MLNNALEGRQAQQVNVNPNANLVHFAAQGGSPAPTSISGGIGNSARLGVSKLIGDARYVSKLQKDHAARQERAMAE